MNKPWGLLTGFGSFPDVSYNPTETLCHRLQNQMLRETIIHSVVLDVHFESIQEQLNKALSANPRFILMTGVAVQRDAIGIEIRAVNTREPGRPDAAGYIPQEGEVVLESLDFAQLLDARIDASAIETDLEKNGIPAEVSTDAGRYLCNAALLNGLNYAQNQDPTPPCVFLHIPQIGNTLRNKPEEQWTEDLLQVATWRVLKMLSTAIVD